jgi:hypothetical protein
MLPDKSDTFVSISKQFCKVKMVFLSVNKSFHKVKTFFPTRNHVISTCKNEKKMVYLCHFTFPKSLPRAFPRHFDKLKS